MILISSVSASDLNSTDNPVEIAVDDSLISTDVSGSFDDLRNAIYSSNQIDLTGDVVNNGAKEIVINANRNITINGNGHTINANNNGRIFVVLPGGQLNLNNVKLINGRLPETLMTDFDGGAILNMGVLNIYNCQFNNNYARDGGAIAAGAPARRLSGR